jgi:hypothetical protein
MLLSRHHNLGQDLNIKFGNRYFENEVKLKYEYLGTTLTNQNRIREKIKTILNSGDICYYLVQNF